MPFFIVIITDSGEAESESIPLKIRYDQIFFYDPTQRHRDHREKQSLRVLCGFVWDFFMIPHRCTEITGENRASVFSAALCGIFL